MIKDNLPQATTKEDFRFVVENNALQLVTIRNKGNILLKLLDITGSTSNFGELGVYITDDISTPYYEGTVVLSDYAFSGEKRLLKKDPEMSRYGGIPTDSTTNIIIDFFCEIR